MEMGDRINKDLTQEEEELLKQDLSGRLFYGVKIKLGDYYYQVCGYNPENSQPVITSYYRGADNDILSYLLVTLEDYRPCLRPLESITEEEERELYKKYNCEFVGKRLYRVRYHSEGYWDSDTEVSRDDYCWVIDWLNRHHFDYRGLISKGLAIEAPPGLY